MERFTESSAKISPSDVLRYGKQTLLHWWRVNKHWALPGGSPHFLWDHQSSKKHSFRRENKFIMNNERKRQQSLNSGDLHKRSISKIFLAHSSLVQIIIKTFFEWCLGWGEWVSQWDGHAVENMFGEGAEFWKGRDSKMSCMSVFPNKKKLNE